MATKIYVVIFLIFLIVGAGGQVDFDPSTPFAGVFPLSGKAMSSIQSALYPQTIPPSSPNLLINGAFDGFDGWATGGSVYLDPKSGHAVFPPGKGGSLSQEIPSIVGALYGLSASLGHSGNGQPQDLLIRVIDTVTQAVLLDLTQPVPPDTILSGSYIGTGNPVQLIIVGVSPNGKSVEANLDNVSIVLVDLPIDTPVPTETPTSTDTPVPTDTETLVPTETPIPTDTETLVPTDIPTEVPTMTLYPTTAPTDASTATPTFPPTETSTETPTVPSTETPTRIPDSTSTPSPVILALSFPSCWNLPTSIEYSYRLISFDRLELPPEISSVVVDIYVEGNLTWSGAIYGPVTSLPFERVTTIRLKEIICNQ